MTATLRLSINGVGKLGRSVELQQLTRSKPEDERLQLNSLDITVPDHLTLLSRNKVNNRTGRNGFDLLEANVLSISPKVAGGSGNWLSSNNARGRNLRMKELNLICLIFRYQTT